MPKICPLLVKLEKWHHASAHDMSCRSLIGLEICEVLINVWFCCSANDKNHCTCPAAIFSSDQCTNPKGECIVMWKYQRASALMFIICTSTKSNQSLTSFIHVHIITETIMECIYFKIRLNYQNNPILSDIQLSNPPWPKWIMLTLHWFARVMSYFVTQWRSHALSDINERFWTGLFQFISSCHWLLSLIHINECMN